MIYDLTKRLYLELNNCPEVATVSLNVHSGRQSMSDNVDRYVCRITVTDKNGKSFGYSIGPNHSLRSTEKVVTDEKKALNNRIKDIIQSVYYSDTHVTEYSGVAADFGYKCCEIEIGNVAGPHINSEISILIPGTETLSVTSSTVLNDELTRYYGTGSTAGNYIFSMSFYDIDDIQSGGVLYRTPVYVWYIANLEILEKDGALMNRMELYHVNIGNILTKAGISDCKTRKELARNYHHTTYRNMDIVNENVATKFFKTDIIPIITRKELDL